MQYLLLVGGSCPTTFTSGEVFKNKGQKYILLKNDDGLSIICRYLSPEESWERNCYLLEDVAANETFATKGAGVSIISYPSNQMEEGAEIRRLSSL